MSPEEQSTLQDNFDFMDKIDASDLILVVLLKNVLYTSISSPGFFNLLIILTEAKTAIRKKCPERKVYFSQKLLF